MRIQLLLPSVPGFFICNVVLAFHTSCSHLRNVFTGFIVKHVFSSKTPLFIEGVKSFISAPDEKTEKLTSVIRAIARDNQGNMFVGTSVTGLFFFPKGETVAHRILLDNRQSQFDVMAIKKERNNKFCLQNNGITYAKNV